MIKLRIIAYYPELNAYTGGVYGSLLMAQLEYWFKKTEGKKFYKFLEPCGHEAYQVGDSWLEELGFTSANFRTAFRRIGTVYKSRQAYEESTDKFQGKLYLSYFDRIKKLTYYIRNDALVNELLTNLEKQEVEVDTEEKWISTNEESKDGITEDYSKRLLTENKRESIHTTHSDLEVPYEKIKGHFNTICTSHTPIQSLTQKQKQRLKSLWKKYQKDVDTFIMLFEKVEQSDFLSGRVEGRYFKPSLDWILKSKNVEKILQDGYKNFSQVSGGSKKVQLFNQMDSREWDFNELERLEREYVARVLDERGYERIQMIHSSTYEDFGKTF